MQYSHINEFKVRKTCKYANFTQLVNTIMNILKTCIHIINQKIQRKIWE
jgi:hypothetical protein